MVQSVDQVTGTLADWLRGRFADVPVYLDVQAASTAAPVVDGRPTICISLRDLAVETTGNTLSPTTVLRLDYFITADAGDVLATHRVLGEVAFAIAENPVLEIRGGEPVVLRLERRDGAPLGIAVSTSLSRARSREAAPPVRQAPVVRVGPLGVIDGVVRGPDGRAIAGAVVEIASLRLSQITGSDGRFRFDTPLESAYALEVTVRKQRFSKTVTAGVCQHLTLQLSAENEHADLSEPGHIY